jgi:hypothetical protein
VWLTGAGERFGLPLEPATSALATVPTRCCGPGATGLLVEYHDATFEQTIRFVRELTDDMAKVVDRRWDPPVTMGVRLVSVLTDDLEHAGQAASSAA